MVLILRFGGGGDGMLPISPFTTMKVMAVVLFINYPLEWGINGTVYQIVLQGSLFGRQFILWKCLPEITELRNCLDALIQETEESVEC